MRKNYQFVCQMIRARVVQTNPAQNLRTTVPIAYLLKHFVMYCIS